MLSHNDEPCLKRAGTKCFRKTTRANSALVFRKQTVSLRHTNKRQTEETGFMSH